LINIISYKIEEMLVSYELDSEEAMRARAKLVQEDSTVVFYMSENMFTDALALPVLSNRRLSAQELPKPALFNQAGSQ